MTRRSGSRNSHSSEDSESTSECDSGVRRVRRLGARRTPSCELREHFVDLVVIRQRGAFHLFGGRSRCGSVRVVVAASPLATRGEAIDRLRSLARAHRAVDLDLVAKVAETGLDARIPWVAFHAEGVMDGEAVFAALAAREETLSYPEAMGFVDALVRLGEVVHVTPDPVTGAPMRLGGLSFANFIVARDGRLSYVGLGHNVCVYDEKDRHNGNPGAFLPPEASLGIGVPSGDLYAAVLLLRSAIPFVDLPRLLATAFRGAPEGQSPSLAAALRWVNRAILSAPPTVRPTVRAVRRAFATAWQLMGVVPDSAGLASHLAHLVDVSTPRGTALEVAEGGTWFRPPHTGRVDVGGRRAIQNILLALVKAHRSGVSLSVCQLLDAGWGTERILRRAGRNRVHVALTTLRQKGLRDVIQRHNGGYRLDPWLEVVTTHPSSGRT